MVHPLLPLFRGFAAPAEVMLIFFFLSTPLFTEGFFFYLGYLDCLPSVALSSLPRLLVGPSYWVQPVLRRYCWDSLSTFCFGYYAHTSWGLCRAGWVWDYVLFCFLPPPLFFPPLPFPFSFIRLFSLYRVPVYLTDFFSQPAGHAILLPSVHIAIFIKYKYVTVAICGYVKPVSMLRFGYCNYNSLWLHLSY